MAQMVPQDERGPLGMSMSVCTSARLAGRDLAGPSCLKPSTRRFLNYIHHSSCSSSPSTNWNRRAYDDCICAECITSDNLCARLEYYTVEKIKKNKRKIRIRKRRKKTVEIMRYICINVGLYHGNNIRMFILGLWLIAGIICVRTDVLDETALQFKNDFLIFEKNVSGKARSFFYYYLLRLRYIYICCIYEEAAVIDTYGLWPLLNFPLAQSYHFDAITVFYFQFNLLW